MAETAVMQETREDRILRVALSYAIATGVRGNSKRTRGSKAPLGEILSQSPQQANLRQYVETLKTRQEISIPVDHIAGEARDNSHNVLNIFYYDDALAFLSSATEGSVNTRTNAQLDRTELLRPKKGGARKFKLDDLEARIDGLTQSDPLFRAAVDHQGDDTVLLEAIDARNRAQDIYSSRPWHYGKKVLKSPHFYQLLLGAATFGLINHYGQDLAQALNGATSHPGPVKWLFDKMMSKDPLDNYTATTAKLAIAWLFSGFFTRFLGGVIDIPKEYQQRRKGNERTKPKGLVRATLETALSIPAKTIDAAHYGDAIGRDLLIGGVAMPLAFTLTFPVSNAVGNVACNLVDAGSELLTHHRFTTGVFYNPHIGLPVVVGGKTVLEPMLYTWGAPLRSIILCVAGLFGIFKPKYATQRYIEDSGGFLGTLARPFVEGYRSVGRLQDRIEEKGFSLGVLGGHIRDESRNLGRYAWDLYWSRSYTNPKTRDGVRRADATLLSYWPPAHTPTSTLIGGGHPVEIPGVQQPVAVPSGVLAPYQIALSTALSPVLATMIMLYQKIFSGKPQDLYQTRVSPQTYTVLTAKPATVPA